MSEEPEQRHPLHQLEEADLEFVLRLVLASGSLKELAAGYGVSYPTIRSRLDRVIARLKDIQARRPLDPMAGLLADLVEKGELASPAARDILELHRRQSRRQKES